MSYELYHHGILGMHWGIRRFQNKDGSLTAEGKKRYGSDIKEKSVSTSSESRTAISKQTDNFYSNQSNKGKFDFGLEIEDNPKCKALADRFMSGEFNKAIYEKILDETYDGYLDWCKQGDIKPVNKIDYMKGIRKAGFNSGGVDYSPRLDMASMILYINDNDYFWGHVFSLEISDTVGVMKRKVGLEG